MKKIIKINKTVVLLVFYLLCTAVPLKAQSYFTREFRFSVKIEDAAKFTNNSTLGIKGNADGNPIWVSVFTEAGYSSANNINSATFLYGVYSNNTSTALTNNSMGTITIPSSGIYGYLNPFSRDVLVQSNNLTIFRKRLYEKAQSGKSWFSNLRGSTIDIVVKVTIGNGNTLAPITGIILPGLKEFNPNDAVTGKILVFRGDYGVPVQSLYLNSAIDADATYRLETFQGDNVVFIADQGTNPDVENLTDTNIMRWAGESIFMENTYNPGEHKPFLFFDSNVHGVKMRKYPQEWRINGKEYYNEYYSKFDLIDAKLRLSWLANGRYDFPENINTAQAHTEVFLSGYKTRPDGLDFPNTNKFFGSPSAGIAVQRNNQKEGLNMELLDAFQCNRKYVAGLDPDELIYNNFNQSDIVGNPAAAGKTFSYVANDQWKIIPNDERGNINEPMKKFLTQTIQFATGNSLYQYKGREIIDFDLFVHKTGTTTIENKSFSYGDIQPMFNNKQPVYYNDVVSNSPRVSTKTLKFRVNQQVFNIQLAVLSPLEGERRNKAYNALTAADRSNPLVNFSGIINGPTCVARFQDVSYTAANLPDYNSVPGKFTLVYTYEDSFGILTEKRQVVDSNFPKFTFAFGGGGYHEITLRYKRDKAASDDAEVIIAGKELIDMDLRFIFSPNAEDGNDFSFNPDFTFGNNSNTTSIGGNIRLNENKANGKQWFLENSVDLPEANGYKNHRIVRTYALDRDESMVLTVLDADPHTFVHYQPDFYLSERRLSKRLTDADLENASGDSKIEWFVAKDENFTNGNQSVGFGRYFKVSPKALYPGGWFTGAYKGDFFIKAVYNNTSEIKVKIVQKEFVATLDSSVDIGDVGIYNLNTTQFDLLQTIASGFYNKTADKYRIYKIQDLLSSYVYGQKNTATNEVAKRYISPGSTAEVGEHKRFSDQNNYDSRFTWTFRHPTNNNILPSANIFVDFAYNNNYYNNIYVANYQNNWFPKNWVRHLDSPARSPEIPVSSNTEYNLVKKFDENQTAGLQSYNNVGSLYEPWQVRLPWITTAGVHGYKTRWNIKCVYDVSKLFNASQFGKAYSLSEDSGTYATSLAPVIPGYGNDDRERQEFFTMLKNKEIVVVDVEALNGLTGSSSNINISVLDAGNVTVFGNTISKSTTPVSRLAQGKNESSLATNNDTGLFKVYPNPSSSGIFKLDIKIPEENSQLELQLVDITGKIIYRSATDRVSGNYSTTVGEKLNLPKGVYLLTIKVNNVSETKKVVVE